MSSGWFAKLCYLSFKAVEFRLRVRFWVSLSGPLSVEQATENPISWVWDVYWSAIKSSGLSARWLLCMTLLKTTLRLIYFFTSFKELLIVFLERIIFDTFLMSYWDRLIGNWKLSRSDFLTAVINLPFSITILLGEFVFLRCWEDGLILLEPLRLDCGDLSRFFF